MEAELPSRRSPMAMLTQLKAMQVELPSALLAMLAQLEALAEVELPS